MHVRRSLAAAIALGLALAGAGCSISASSVSISDSISGSSKSSSDSISSSSPDGSSSSEHAYREDVRDYAASAARSGRTAVELESGLASLAERHGVTNWEADDATWIGIGEGLRISGATPEGVARWSSEFGSAPGGREQAGRLILRGYDAGRS